MPIVRCSDMVYQRFIWRRVAQAGDGPYQKATAAGVDDVRGDSRFH